MKLEMHGDIKTESPRPCEPRGPLSALQSAIVLILPERDLPRSRTRGRKSPLLAKAIAPKTYPKEYKLCREVADHYLWALELDRDAPSLAATLEHFRYIGRLSRELARALFSLTIQERFLIGTLYDDSPQTLEKLSNLAEKFPPLPPSDKPREGGEFYGHLYALAEFVVHYNRVLNQRFRRPGDGRTDRGGATNVWRRLAPAPIWILIGAAWSLFENLPHLNPTATRNGDLYNFVHAIDQWSTGRSPKYIDKLLSSYASCKKDCSRLENQFSTIQRRAGISSVAELEALVSRRVKHPHPALTDKMVRQAKQNIRLRREHDHFLQFGRWPKPNGASRL